MITVIESALNLASEVASILKIKEDRKYIDRIIKLQLEIKEENAKGYYSDDAKIEELSREAKIIFEAIQKDVSATRT